MNSLKRTTIRIFWGIFSLSIWMILVAAITKPLNNLIPKRMAVYTLVWIALWAGVWFVLCQVEKRCKDLGKLVRVGTPIFLLLFGTVLYVVSCLLRSSLLTDYQNVYEAAYGLAMGEEITNWEYFARWNNNVGCMVILSLLFRAGKWLQGVMDLYYFVLFLNVLQVVGVVYCVCYLAGKTVKKHSAAVSLMALIMGGLWIPLWANTSIFYSDQISIGAGIFGVTLLVKGYEKKRRLLYCALAGVFFGSGVIMKATVGTILVALLIGIFLFGKLKKYWKEVVATLGTALLVTLCFSLYFQSLPYQKDVERLKAPIEYWIALGLGENGTYASSEEFAIRCLDAENVEQRREIARKQIRDHIGNLWSVEHIIGKARQNFGCGDMGAAGYLLYPENENLLWNWFSQEGQYYWKYACLSTAFFFSLLFLLGVGGLTQVFHKGDYERENFAFMVSALAFWGLCLFLMLWEAQDKQLYNHSAWMMLSLIYSLKELGEKIGVRTQ